MYVKRFFGPAPQLVPISAAERRRREEAVRYARASINLSGLAPSQATEELARRFIEGEIELTGFVKASITGSACRQ